MGVCLDLPARATMVAQAAYFAFCLSNELISCKSAKSVLKQTLSSAKRAFQSIEAAKICSKKKAYLQTPFKGFGKIKIKTTLQHLATTVPLHTDAFNKSQSECEMQWFVDSTWAFVSPSYSYIVNGELLFITATNYNFL